MLCAGGWGWHDTSLCHASPFARFEFSSAEITRISSRPAAFAAAG
jgi:hypothetical protein